MSQPTSTQRITPTWWVGACLAPLLLIGVPAQGQSDRLLKQVAERGLDPETVTEPLRVDDAMRAFARQAMRRHGGEAKLRMQALLDHLTDPEQLELSYRWGHTGTTQEVFSTGEANCLAFTNLYVGMARSVGLPVYYILVHDGRSFRKEEDLVIVSDHVAVGYGLGPSRLIIDLAAEPENRTDPRKLERISDLTALALFYTNRGAEALRRDEVDIALAQLRTAVALDDQRPAIWTNYGVALRRSGASRSAEEAYRKALELDPRATSAIANLASLLRLERRRDEAEALEAVLARRPGRNPFTYLALGDISLANGRAHEAARLYRRAVRLDKDHAEAWAALGQAELALGDPVAARRHLRKARKRDAEHPRTDRLARALGAETG